MTAAPYLLGRRGPGAYVAPGSGGGTGDGGFVDQPVVTTTSSGDTTIKGKVKSGSFGKFVVPLATVQAGRQYTFRYTPQFAQLAQQGKLAMVGFGFKTNNDFHIVGLRGDGSTGLHKYQVYGTPPNGWNAQTGHTVNDGGAAASGTQAGPNYLRLIVSSDGSTYILQSSANGTIWNTEFVGQTPSPFSNVSGATTFGVALWFNNADAGPFSITIDQFADAVAGDPYFSNVVLLMGFNGSNGATSTSDESSSAKSVTFNGNAKLDTGQAKFGVSSLALDGVGDFLSLADSADWDFGSGQFTVEAFIRLSAVDNTYCIVSQWSATSSNTAWAFFGESGTPNLVMLRFVDTGGTTRQASAAVTNVANQWFHFAADRDATGKVRVYIDGVMQGSTINLTQTIRNSPSGLRVGSIEGFSAYDTPGWLDELRITKGVARYASDSGFTVPTAAFPRS